MAPFLDAEIESETTHKENNPLENGNATTHFPLGKVVGTPGALRVLAANGRTPAEFLDRHARGDWGQVDAEDGRINDEALRSGDRLVSAYLLAGGERIWIITEADRLCTCILLPSEY